MDRWCLVRLCFEKMVVADVLGCSCQKRGRMKKSWLVHVSLFFEGKNQANVGRGSILPALPVGPTGPWMYQGWSSGAMHSCYRSLVLKTKGNCFSWDFVTIFWRSHCTLMCWCVLINWKEEYNMIASVLSPNGGARNHSKRRKGRETRIWVASTLGN